MSLWKLISRCFKMDWKVYVYDTELEQDVFDAFTSLIPSDEDNLKFLSQLLEVPIQEDSVPPIYTIVDMWIERYKGMTSVQRYISLYPYIRRVQQWLSLVFMKDVSLPIAMYEKHLEFDEHLSRLQWKNETVYDSLFIWSLYLPVVEKLHNMSEFESGEIYSKLPNTISGVSDNKELEIVLRNHFIDEVEKLLTTDTDECVYRTIHPLEMKEWILIYRVFML